MYIIQTTQDLAKGCRWLGKNVPAFDRALRETGLPPLRRRAPGFAGLARVVVAQQLSAASAEAIWQRLDQAVDLSNPKNLIETRDDVLRTCGLSGGKIVTLHEIAKSIVSGALAFEALEGLGDAVVSDRLCELKGVGPWTAQIYLLSCLGRADVFPAGDLALQKGAADLFELEDRPDSAALEAMAIEWRPWRAVAARLLWAYYSHRLKSDIPVGG